MPALILTDGGGVSPFTALHRLLALVSLSLLSTRAAGMVARLAGLALVWEVGNQGVLVLHPLLSDTKPFCSSGLNFLIYQLGLGHRPLR